MRWLAGGLLLATVACADAKAPSRMRYLDDGTVAMLREVNDDCPFLLVSRPRLCAWERPLDNAIERISFVKIEVDAAGEPVSAVDEDSDDETGPSCARMLRYAGPGKCTVRLRIVRHATDVTRPTPAYPTIDCTQWGGSGAGCGTIVGPSTYR